VTGQGTAARQFRRAIATAPTLHAALRELYEATHAFLDVHGYPRVPGSETARLNAALADAFRALYRARRWAEEEVGG
jgi:hypothetical protein